jgi:DNA repair exonuclease SbcCD nuclease subunit
MMQRDDALHEEESHAAERAADMPGVNTNAQADENEQAGAEQPPRADDILTIVFTADNHLGSVAFGVPPQKREQRAQRLRRAFQQATDFAIGQGVDFFIQGGDLFDTSTPDERDRSFVAERLAQLKQANIRVFAVGGFHDTPLAADSQQLAPQQSYARLGALHYFAPAGSSTQSLEPLFLTIRGMLVGIAGLGAMTGDPLAHLKVNPRIERAAISLLILHAPIEGTASGSHAWPLVSQSSIENQHAFRYILAGYSHRFEHRRSGKRELIIAGATQHIDFSREDESDDLQAPGFVFLGIAPDGLRWCKHIAVDSLRLRRLVIEAPDLWAQPGTTPTEGILDRLRPLGSPDTLLQLCLQGELTRHQYHQLDLNQIRRYGEQHCFALAIDDSRLSLLPDHADSPGAPQRLSPRQELLSLVEEEIAASRDEQEKRALQITKEELLIALDEVKGRSL